jgi:uncharacterized membrane protein
MTASRWIIAALLIALAGASIYVFSNPEMSARYAQMQRDVMLSTEAKDLVMGGLVILIGGYLAWFLLRRRD